MSNRSAFLLLVLVGALGAGYFFHYYRPQNHLNNQLQLLDHALALENARQATEANRALQALQAAVAINHNAPADARLLRRATALNACIIALQDTLRTTRARLRRATANPAAPALLVHFGATAQVMRLLGKGPQQQAFRQQLAACADTLRRLGSATTTLPILPDFTDMPVVDALASLTHLESNILSSQASALQRVSHLVGARQFLSRPLAFATAESNIVAPGDTYRAKLLLVASLPRVRPPMTCNGRPVPVGSDGIGMVRFKAPLRPGPAFWTGTVRLNFNGRDSTFCIMVPYRVAHR